MAASSAQGGQVYSCHSVGEWEEHFKKGVETKKLVVIDFTAEWCGPCKYMDKFLTSKTYYSPHVIFLKVDIDKLGTVAEEFEVQAIPTYVFLKEGKEVDRVVGGKKEDLVKKITEHGTLSPSA